MDNTVQIKTIPKSKIKKIIGSQNNDIPNDENNSEKKNNDINDDNVDINNKNDDVNKNNDDNSSTINSRYRGGCEGEQFPGRRRDDRRTRKTVRGEGP